MTRPSGPATGESGAGPAGLVHSAIFRRGARVPDFEPCDARATFTVWPEGHKVRTAVGRRLQAPQSRPCDGGARRGAVKWFTAKARRRLRDTLAGVDSGAPVLFVTLTYPAGNAPDPERLKADLERFAKRFKREFPEGAFCWVLEHHKSGVPHLHLLVWGAEYRPLRAWAPSAWYEACKTGNPNHLKAGTRVEFPRSGHGLSEYLSKYTGKGRAVGNADGQAWGRWWGMVRRESIPWAEAEEHVIPESVARQLMRWQRRAGTPVTEWARKRAGWTRPAVYSKARFRIPGRQLPSLTRVGPPAVWLRAMAHAQALAGGFDIAPWSSFAAWSEGSLGACGSAPP